MRKLYPQGYVPAPQILVPEAPSEKGKGAAKGKALSVRKPQEASRYMPKDVRGLPVRKPGYYKEDLEGIKPEAIMQLSNMDSRARNEVERKAEAIRLCM